MRLYHGTLEENFQSIILEKRIRTSNKNNTQYSTEGPLKTTPGYVYLSKSLNEALGFAILASLENINSKRKDVAIFEIDIKENENEYEIDKDEKRNRALVTQVELPENSCLRINRDLLFEEDVKRYCLLKFKDSNKGFRYADDPRLDLIIKDTWKDI